MLPFAHHVFTIMSKTDKLSMNLVAEKTSTMPVVLKCMPCSLEDRVCDACCFCIQCVEHLCTDCAKDHRKIKLTRSHVLLEGQEMPTNASAFKKMAKVTFCKIHEDRDVEFLCVPHDDLICPLCIRDGHRACKDIVSMRTVFCDKEQFRRDYFEKCLSLKRLVEMRYERALAGVRNMDHTSKIEKQIPEFVTELQSMALLFSKDLNKAIHKLKKDNPDLLTTEVSDLELFLKSLNTNVTVSDFALKYGTDAQLTVLARGLREYLVDTELLQSMTNREDSELGLVSLSFDNITAEMEKVRLAMTGLKEACSSLIGPTTNKQPWMDTDTSGISKVVKNENSKSVASKEVGTQVDNDISFPEPNLLDAVLEEKEQGACKHSEQSDADISSESVFPTLFESRIRKSIHHDISVDIQGELCNHTSSFVFKDGYMVFMDKTNNILKLVSSLFEIVSCYSFSQETEVKDIGYLSGSLIVIAYRDKIETFCVCLSCEEFHQVDDMSMSLDSSPCSIMPLYDDDDYDDDEDNGNDDCDVDDDEGDFDDEEYEYDDGDDEDDDN